jgi:ribonuclease HI
VGQDAEENETAKAEEVSPKLDPRTIGKKGGMTLTFTIHILIDSSTKPSSKTSKYGESAACWAIYPSEITSPPEYVGLIYRPKEGPNKIFYIGVIRALEELFESQYVKYSLKIRGDCQPVIDQLNGKWRAVGMKSLYDQVKSLEKKIMKEKGAQIEYEYLGEDDSVYKKIDQCAKLSREFIKRQLF